MMTDVANLHVYEVDDGERHWILAEKPEDATRCFYETYCANEAERADCELSKPQLTDQDKVTITDDESGGYPIPLRQVVREHLARPTPSVPVVLASTVW